MGAPIHFTHNPPFFNHHLYTHTTEEVRFNFDDQPPSLLVSEYALGAKWFTQASYAQNFFLTNTFSQDDCTPQASINRQFTNLAKNCAATTATVSATG